MKNCLDVGNITLKALEDKDVILTIITALERQIPKTTTETQELINIEYICSECDCINKNKFNYCWSCGQSIINI